MNGPDTGFMDLRRMERIGFILAMVVSGVRMDVTVPPVTHSKVELNDTSLTTRFCFQKGKTCPGDNLDFKFVSILNQCKARCLRLPGAKCESAFWDDFKMCHLRAKRCKTDELVEAEGTELHRLEKGEKCTDGRFIYKYTGEKFGNRFCKRTGYICNKGLDLDWKKYPISDPDECTARCARVVACAGVDYNHIKQECILRELHCTDEQLEEDPDNYYFKRLREGETQCPSDLCPPHSTMSGLTCECDSGYVKYGEYGLNCVKLPTNKCTPNEVKEPQKLESYGATSITEQSTTVEGSHLAMDSSTQTCSQTKPITEDSWPWFSFSLLEKAIITDVRLRINPDHPIDNLGVMIDIHVCNFEEGPIMDWTNFKCHTPLCGSDIIVQAFDSGPLSICSIDVYGQNAEEFVPALDTCQAKMNGIISMPMDPLTAMQSATVNPDFKAKHAVDGSADNCAIAAPVDVDQKPWWSIELFNAAIVHAVAIHMNPASDNVVGFTIRVESTTCVDTSHKFVRGALFPVEFHCEKPICGWKITIEKVDSEPLRLCQVVVYGQTDNPCPDNAGIKGTTCVCNDDYVMYEGVCLKIPDEGCLKVGDIDIALPLDVNSARQSSSVDTAPAKFGVDGDDLTCSSTLAGNEDPNPWFGVRLTGPAVVTSVNIKATGSPEAIVSVDTNPCTRAALVGELKCDKLLCGSLIVVILVQRDAQLEICSIVVTGRRSLIYPVGQKCLPHTAPHLIPLNEDKAKLSTMDTNSDAGKAVDDSKTTCAMSSAADTEDFPWWSIEFGQDVTVTEVALLLDFHSDEEKNVGIPFTILVDAESCVSSNFQWLTPERLNAFPRNFNCDNPVCGSELKLKLGIKTMLHLCHIQVRGLFSTRRTSLMTP